MNGGRYFGINEDRKAAIFSSVFTFGWRSICHVVIIAKVKVSFLDSQEIIASKNI